VSSDQEKRECRGTPTGSRNRADTTSVQASVTELADRERSLSTVARAMSWSTNDRAHPGWTAVNTPSESIRSGGIISPKRVSSVTF
jgi:hypothetical protein